MASTRVRQLIDAPRERIYAALVDPEAVARWRVPSGMTCEVHEFDAREGGAVRVSLTYDAEDRTGKTEGRTDTYRGRFGAGAARASRSYAGGSPPRPAATLVLANGVVVPAGGVVEIVAPGR